MTKKELYKSLNKEQLINMLLNFDNIFADFIKKMEKITGCACFGDCDAFEGTCIYCFQDNQELYNKCQQFHKDFYGK